jgi:hypothetical protein
MPLGTLVATTEAGATYVLWIHGDGVRWVRLPGAAALIGSKTGWLPQVPRVVPGERLTLGTLRSTRIVNVAFLPTRETDALADQQSAGNQAAQTLAH